MNKRAIVLLWIISFAFLIGIAVFYGSIGKQTPGGETKFLGENEITLFETYQQAEQDMYYLELAAQLSAEQAPKENFVSGFKGLFAAYLQKKFPTQEYEIECTSASGTTTLIGRTEDALIYQEDTYTYTVVPNFKVTLPYAIEECTKKIFE